MLLTLRGTPVLYYGDEIALHDAELDRPEALDPVARRTGDPEDNRDVCRTPIPWTADGAGFTDAGPSRGCRSPTRAATSATSATSRVRRSTSCAT